MRNDLPEKNRREGRDRRSPRDRRQYCSAGYADDERRKNQDRRLLVERRVIIALDRHFSHI